MNLPIIVLACAAAVVAAKLLDFLLGNEGRKRLKENLIFRPWFFLQAARPLAVLRFSATTFSNVINTLFGPRLVSGRAYLASTLIGTATVYLYVLLDTPLHLSTFVDYKDSNLVYYGALFLINPMFDFISFAITRGLARRIVKSETILPALTFWLIDLLLCLLIASATYASVETFNRVVEPRFGLSIWFGVQTHDFSVFTTLTGLIPTLIHLAFFVVFSLAALAETMRRLLSFLLERFDEADQNPVAVIATFLAAVIGLLSALAKVLAG